MYTYTHSSEKMVIFASFFALPTMAALLLHRLCAYIKINRAYTFLSQTPTLRPAKTSFVTCNAFNVYSFVWFCRAIARSSSPRSSVNVTSAFKDYTKHGGAFLPLTEMRAQAFDFSFSLQLHREKKQQREFCALFKEELDKREEDKVKRRRNALTCVWTCEWTRPTRAVLWVDSVF